MDLLTTSLLDLLHEIDGQDIAITVGGGFGLFLKRQFVVATAARTLLERLPEPRSTNDLDLFLRTEVVVHPERFRALAEAIRRLGYTPVKKAEFFQWTREVIVAGVSKEVKIDILVGPLGGRRKELHVSKPRVRPKGRRCNLHAHATEEAVVIEDAPLAVTIAGKLSAGEPYATTINVPQAFPYLMMMKLYAYGDREEKGETGKAQQHALDLYTIVGMMTEDEYERSKELAVVHAGDQHVQRARAIVRDSFAGRTAVGVLRLREHSLYRQDFQLDQFTGVLAEIFPAE